MARRLTPNQVVAHNLRRARGLHMWTQEQAAERLAPFLGERWSKASFSAAERSIAQRDRIRQFTADDLVAFGAAFGLPISFFMVPPRGTEVVAAPKASRGLTTAELAQVGGPRPVEREEELRRAALEKLEGMGIEVVLEPDERNGKEQDR